MVSIEGLYGAGSVQRLEIYWDEGAVEDEGVVAFRRDTNLITLVITITHTFISMSTSTRTTHARAHNQ